MSIRNIGKRLGRWGAICGLFGAGLSLSGCRTQSPEQQFADLPPALTAASSANPVVAPAAAPVPAPAPATTPDAAPVASPGAIAAAASVGGPEVEVLGVGSSLTITLTDTPNPIPIFEGKIKEDGTITLTLNQTFKAAAKTPGDLEKDIRACYVPKYFKYMTVAVKQEPTTLWYYVDGEVKGPSRQLYNIRITVSRAITSTGGFTDFANKKKVRLTRVDGRTQIVNCVKVRDNPSLDPEVYPGDKIYVPRRFW
jgi:protein involved in polysaccharide export with SLBB domain